LKKKSSATNRGKVQDADAGKRELGDHPLWLRQGGGRGEASPEETGRSVVRTEGGVCGKRPVPTSPQNSRGEFLLIFSEALLCGKQNEEKNASAF